MDAQAHAEPANGGCSATVTAQMRNAGGHLLHGFPTAFYHTYMRAAQPNRQTACKAPASPLPNLRGGVRGTQAPLGYTGRQASYTRKTEHEMPHSAHNHPADSRLCNSTPALPAAAPYIRVDRQALYSWLDVMMGTTSYSCMGLQLPACIRMDARQAWAVACPVVAGGRHTPCLPAPVQGRRRRRTHHPGPPEAMPNGACIMYGIWRLSCLRRQVHRARRPGVPPHPAPSGLWSSACRRPCPAR